MTTPTVVKFDGGTRPDNPGPSAIGYIVETDDLTEERSEHIGESTNNRTEYRALIQGLELASEKGCTEVEARGDSGVIVNQVRGEYGVNEPVLRLLRDRVQELSDEFGQFEIQHIPREENWEAVSTGLYYQGRIFLDMSNLLKRASKKYKRDGIIPLLESASYHFGNSLSDVSKREKKKSVIKNYTDVNKYLNIGGGDFVREDWRVLDYADGYDYGDIFIDYDINLEELNKWPIEDNSFDLVFSSHTLEHLSDKAVRHTLNESKRILKPNGTLRLNVPNIEIAKRKYENKNITWFVKRKGDPPVSELNCQEFEKERYLLMFFASHLVLGEQNVNVDFKSVRSDYNRMEDYEFFQKYSNKVKDKWQENNPGWHRNWYNYERLSDLMYTAGFKQVSRKGCQISEELEFTYEKLNKRPYMSVFAEANL